MTQAKIKHILLFISKKSYYFWTDITSFKKIIITLSQKSPFKIEVIDIHEKPELAEKYKIEALPTLIIDEKKYIGKPTAEKLIEIIDKA